MSMQDLGTKNGRARARVGSREKPRLLEVPGRGAVGNDSTDTAWRSALDPSADLSGLRRSVRCGAGGHPVSI